uniref:Uncharacterized protein n=1 Tax=Octopus bimaculoides TaxID=37653 RepID=A0A0L8G721_OCTBM
MYGYCVCACVRFIQNNELNKMHIFVSLKGSSGMLMSFSMKQCMHFIGGGGL